MRYLPMLVIAMWILVATRSLAMQAADEKATGTIIGSVVDAAGSPVAGCIVTAQENAEKMRFGVQGTTDAKGVFKLEKVAEGDYNLNVRSPDGKSRAIKSLSVIAGKSTDAGKLTLKPTK